MLKALGQLFSDKIAADQQEDRPMYSGVAGLQSFYDFVYEWHLNRYGLRKIAEVHLVDLLHSARMHHKAAYRIQVFCDVCHLRPTAA